MMVRGRAVRTGLWIVALLACAELALRFGVGLGDPPLVHLHEDTEYELVPNRQYHRFGNLIAINGAGMRGPEISPTRGSRDRRVLLIGDSVIYGNHFLDQSEIIASQMQRLLDTSTTLRGCTTLVMAAAASSWGPANQAAFLKKNGLFQADLGLLVVSAHDLYDIPLFDRVTPYRISSPLNALDDARQILQERLIRRATPALSPAEQRRITLAALDMMMDQFGRAGIPLALVYHPTTSERNGAPRPERDAFAEWAQRHGLEFLDLGTVPLTEALYRDHIHPNALGARSLAEILSAHAANRLPDCL